MLTVRVRKRRDEFVLDATLDVPTPGVVALFGRSGCGKTTLVNVIAGLLDADEARIELDGTVLDDTRGSIHVPAERRRVGYVFQDARLFPHLDVLGNLRYGERRAQGVQQRIGFDQVVQLLGLSHLLSRRVHTLSGGERQRVALGRALLSQPRLLLLDEPLASLDVQRREEVLPYLERLRDELALPIVYVSHQFEEVLRLATHVVLLEHGRVVAQGDLEEVSLHPQLRAIVGPDALGAVVSGDVEGVQDHTGLVALRVGNNLLSVSHPDVRPGVRLRVQLLARDIILATSPPQGLSVRNVLHGTIAAIEPDGESTDLVRIDVGGSFILSRITHPATLELRLRTGMAIWALVKAVSTRGHAFVGSQAAHSERAAAPLSE